MKHWKLMLTALLLLGSWTFMGCNSDPGEIEQPTKEQIENDPAQNEPGGV